MMHAVSRWFLLIFLSLQAMGANFSVAGGSVSIEAASPPDTAGKELYSEYALVLENVDSEGMVNYRKLKSDRKKLDQFAGRLASLSEELYAGWSRKEQIAFWLNAYNGLTLLAIVDHYPIRSSFFASLRFPKNSIRQISGVWDELSFKVMGKGMTLDSIEHNILREQFNEPRIHMALVCAARGCPPLRQEPYQGESLTAQLEDQSRRFLSNPEKFRFDKKTGTVYISKIFSWFGKDFIAEFGGKPGFERFSKVESAFLSFVAANLEIGKSRLFASEVKRIKYFDYDWSLNEQSHN